jgi:thiol:disulfide interchange protein DsbD
MMKPGRFLCLLALLFAFVPARAQMLSGKAVEWTVVAGEPDAEGICELVFTGTPAPMWHGYGTRSTINATTLTLTSLEGCEAQGALYDLSPAADPEEGFSAPFQLGVKVKLTGKAPAVKGYLTYTACKQGVCAVPEDWAFSLDLPRISAAASPGRSSSGGLWALILEAILWGLAMLLTPCVFPMVPMTVSFFLKSADSPARGRFRAFMYGVFIVLLYTLPICVIIGATRLLGGDAVTADIFNWLSTHWLPNLVFFVVFMLFAASFFGAFEITLPSSLVNKSDRQSEKGGLGGIFFMALTLVLVSFSCTGPIVGSVLIRSTSGEFWAPMVTMLAFSVAFALPFTLLALFPSLLGKFKSGSWLGSVKIVLGFVELALGLKFLSVADQTYHWGILDREVYLAIWIVVFSLLGLYLLGKLRFAHDELADKPLSVLRLALAIAVFSFVVYLVPGMWGAPLKALSGYLPPMQTQDFVLGASSADSASNEISAEAPQLALPYGLRAYTRLEDGLEASARLGKPVFVDITGHGCVNCREMEQRVWSDPRVLPLLRNRYVLVALYTDDKTVLPERERVTLPGGQVLRDVGRVNAYLARERFGVNAQPTYILLGADGRPLLPPRGYNLDVDGFVAFLNEGLQNF